MWRRKTLAGLAGLAFVLLQLSDCLAAPIHEPQMMPCCREMRCPDAKMASGCCKTMEESSSLSARPTSRTTVAAPVLAAAVSIPTAEPVAPKLIPLAALHPQMHSPPDLFTLHHSLLI
jgi:hypothetical protein